MYEEQEQPDLEMTAITALRRATRLAGMAEDTAAREPAKAMAYAAAAQAFTSIAQTCVAMLQVAELDIGDE